MAGVWELRLPGALDRRGLGRVRSLRFFSFGYRLLRRILVED